LQSLGCGTFHPGRILRWFLGLLPIDHNDQSLNDFFGTATPIAKRERGFEADALVGITAQGIEQGSLSFRVAFAIDGAEIPHGRPTRFGIGLALFDASGRPFGTIGWLG
jgi:hypothetical protein